MKLTLALLLGLCACGPPTLEGSLTEIMDLHYRRAEVATSSQVVSVQFVTPQGSGENIVLQVAANLAGTALTPQAYVNLAETAPDGTQRGQISRNVFNDPRQTFPLLDRGQFRLKAAPVSGQKVSGDFSITFVEGIGFASGRTAFGSFQASVL